MQVSQRTAVFLKLSLGVLQSGFHRITLTILQLQTSPGTFWFNATFSWCSCRQENSFYLYWVYRSIHFRIGSQIRKVKIAIKIFDPVVYFLVQQYMALSFKETKYKDMFDFVFFSETDMRLCQIAFYFDKKLSLFMFRRTVLMDINLNKYLNYLHIK